MITKVLHIEVISKDNAEMKLFMDWLRHRALKSVQLTDWKGNSYSIDFKPPGSINITEEHEYEIPRS